MPFYRKDRGAMVQYFEGVGEVLARTEQFGQKRELLDGKLQEIPNQHAYEVVRDIMKAYLEPRPWDSFLSKAYGHIAALEVTSKMMFSPIKVGFHLLHTGEVLNLRTLVHGIIKTGLDYSEMRERALFAGAMTEQNRAANMMEDTNTKLGAAHTFLNSVGFNKLYEMDRIAAFTTANLWMERYALPKLIKKGKSADWIRRQLRDDLLLNDKQIDDAIKNGKWTEADLRHGGVSLVNKTLFTHDPTELPPLWRGRGEGRLSDDLHIAVRVPLMLKSFTYKTADLLKERLVDNLFDGSIPMSVRLGPWIPFLMMYPMAGEAMKALSAAGQTVASAGLGVFTGKKDKFEPWHRYEKRLHEAFDHPRFASLAKLYIEDLASAMAQEWALEAFVHIAFPDKNKRADNFKVKQVMADLLSWFGGPAGSDVWNIGESTVEQGARLARHDRHPEKFWTDEANITLKELRNFSPLLRDVLPDKIDSRPKYQLQMSPPP